MFSFNSVSTKMIEKISFNTCQCFDTAQQSSELVGYITQLT